MLQFEAFWKKEDCFGSHGALTMASMMPAHQWWDANVCKQEAAAGELRLEALKVNCVATYFMAPSLSQACSKCHDEHGAITYGAEKRIMAAAVLNMSASAAGCKINRSTYDFVTNRKPTHQACWTTHQCYPSC